MHSMNELVKTENGNIFLKEEKKKYFILSNIGENTHFAKSLFPSLKKLKETQIFNFIILFFINKSIFIVGMYE